jgi:hypothetical protein
MGDCAIVIFHSRARCEVSPAVYLHWHGGCVLALLETALPHMRTQDAGYSCARFVGVCHQAIPPNTGLGVQNLPAVACGVDQRRTAGAYERVLDEAKKFDWGDRGVFLVDVDAWRVGHAGSCTTAYGDTGDDGFGMQEQTELRAMDGVVQLPAESAGS